MTVYEIIAQLIGIVAMAFNIFSYQQKTPRRVILFQLVGGSLFAVNFFMLGATVGGIMNVIALIRAIIYANKEKFRATHILWLVAFIGLYFASYILTFAVFGTAFTLWNGLLEILPIIAMTASTIGFRLQNANAIRKSGLICSPAWLIYNIANLSIGAIICEVLSLVSIVIGILRLDKKKAA